MKQELVTRADAGEVPGRAIYHVSRVFDSSTPLWGTCHAFCVADVIIPVVGELGAAE
jgi:hypothetical protein